MVPGAGLILSNYIVKQIAFIHTCMVNCVCRCVCACELVHAGVMQRHVKFCTSPCSCMLWLHISSWMEFLRQLPAMANSEDDHAWLVELLGFDENRMQQEGRGPLYNNKMLAHYQCNLLCVSLLCLTTHFTMQQIVHLCLWRQVITEEA
jgi:hypothetical protein